MPQLISEPVLPPSPLLSASLLSEHVERERDDRGDERFRVRTIFHKRGDVSPRRTCITLHAFKETEEHKASCMTEVKTLLLYFLCGFSVYSAFCSSVRLLSCLAASPRAVRDNFDAAQRLVWRSGSQPVSSGFGNVEQGRPLSSPRAEARMAAEPATSRPLRQPSALNLIFTEASQKLTFINFIHPAHLDCVIT